MTVYEVRPSVVASAVRRSTRPSVRQTHREVPAHHPRLAGVPHHLRRRGAGVVVAAHHQL